MTAGYFARPTAWTSCWSAVPSDLYPRHAGVGKLEHFSDNSASSSRQLISPARMDLYGRQNNKSEASKHPGMRAALGVRPHHVFIWTTASITCFFLMLIYILCMIDLVQKQQCRAGGIIVAKRLLK